MTWFVFYKLGFVLDPLPVIEYAFLFSKGKKIADIEYMVDEFFEKVLKFKIYPESISIIKKHQDEGREVILVSNAIGFLVHKVATYLNITTYFSTKLEIVDGVCTGKIVGGIMYSEQKLNAARQYSKLKNMSLNNSWSYADDGTDVYLMSHTAHPYAVNPNKKLKKVANIRGWPVLNFKL